MTVLTERSTDSLLGDPFEFQLEKLLKPRQANPVFVSNLKRKLLTQPEITIETRNQYRAFWIIAAALFFGALSVFLFTRKVNKSKESE